MKIKILFIILVLLNFASFAQKEYDFGSTGQQKLLINPALAGSSEGLNIQTLSSYNSLPYHSNMAVYTGIDYSLNNFNIGLSNGYFAFTSGLYQSNQTDLSVGYKIKLGKKVNLIPAMQLSFYDRKVNRSKTDFMYIGPVYDGGSIACGDYNYYTVIKSTNYVSYSSGFVLDINRSFTFGASFLDINQEDNNSYNSHGTRNQTQNYHLSGILFKNRSVTLQPYSILKLKGFSREYVEAGVYTNYKILSLHIGFRENFGWNHAILGISANYKRFKFGYTLNHYVFTIYNNHEVFFSANLFNKDKSAQRNLMLN